MAVFFRDLDDAERVALTGAMTRSGTVLEWDDGPVVDKHSTGGVGDKVSLHPRAGRRGVRRARCR